MFSNRKDIRSLRHLLSCRLPLIMVALTRSSIFSNIILGCIFFSALLIGIQSYDSLEGHLAVILADWFILGVFTLEVVAKILAENSRPWRFFTGPERGWNIFDFCIVVFCMPFIPVNSNSVGFLRLIRLFRVVKVFRRVQQLHVILVGMVVGLKSVIHITILMLLIFYIFAVLAVFLFRENDPGNFGNLLITTISLFRCATLEDWTDLMYINMFGCDEYDGGLYFPNDTTSQFHTLIGTFYRFTCVSPRAQWTVSLLYFIFFEIISAFVVLSLFIGAVTLSMSDILAEQYRQRKRAKIKATLSAEWLHGTVMKALEDKLIDGVDLQPDIFVTSANEPSAQNQVRSSLVSASKVPHPKHKLMKGATMMSLESSQNPPLRRLQRGVTISDMRHERANKFRRHSSFHRAMALSINQKDWLKKFWIGYLRFSLNCRHVVESHMFEVVMLCSICTAGILVGLNTVLVENKGINIADKSILAIFTVEFIIKLFAEGRKPYRYFTDPWNRFDSAILLVSYVSMLRFLQSDNLGSFISSMRLARILRVLKLIKSFPRLRIAVEALLKGFSSMMYISLVMLVIFYMFAIVGMILFKDNDPWHFGLLQDAMLTLFRCATLDDWTDVMYINMWGCDHYGYNSWPELCTSPVAWGWLATVYFVSFTVVGSMVLVTLFLGVVSTGMEQAHLRFQMETNQQEEINQAVQKHRITPYGIRLLFNAFSLLDENDSGLLEYEELVKVLMLMSPNFDEETCREIYEQVDADQSGEIDFAEFINLMILIKQWVDSRTLKEKKKTLKRIRWSLSKPNKRVHAGLGPTASERQSVSNTFTGSHKDFRVPSEPSLFSARSRPSLNRAASEKRVGVPSSQSSLQKQGVKFQTLLKGSSESFHQTSCKMDSDSSEPLTVENKNEQELDQAILHKKALHRKALKQKLQPNDFSKLFSIKKAKRKDFTIVQSKAKRDRLKRKEVLKQNYQSYQEEFDVLAHKPASEKITTAQPLLKKSKTDFKIKCEEELECKPRPLLKSSTAEPLVIKNVVEPEWKKAEDSPMPHDIVFKGKYCHESSQIFLSLDNESESSNIELGSDIIRPPLNRTPTRFNFNGIEEIRDRRLALQHLPAHLNDNGQLSACVSPSNSSIPKFISPSISPPKLGSPLLSPRLSLALKKLRSSPVTIQSKTSSIHEEPVSGGEQVPTKFNFSENPDLNDQRLAVEHLSAHLQESKLSSRELSLKIPSEKEELPTQPLLKLIPLDRRSPPTEMIVEKYTTAKDLKGSPKSQFNEKYVFPPKAAGMQRNPLVLRRLSMQSSLKDHSQKKSYVVKQNSPSPNAIVKRQAKRKRLAAFLRKGSQSPCQKLERDRLNSDTNLEARNRNKLAERSVTTERHSSATKFHFNRELYKSPFSNSQPRGFKVLLAPLKKTGKGRKRSRMINIRTPTKYNFRHFPVEDDASTSGREVGKQVKRPILEKNSLSWQRGGNLPQAEDISPKNLDSSVEHTAPDGFRSMKSGNNLKDEERQQSSTPAQFSEVTSGQQNRAHQTSLDQSSALPRQVSARRRVDTREGWAENTPGTSSSESSMKANSPVPRQVTRTRHHTKEGWTEHNQNKAVPSVQLNDELSLSRPILLKRAQSVKISQGLHKKRASLQRASSMKLLSVPESIRRSSIETARRMSGVLLDQLVARNTNFSPRPSFLSSDRLPSKKQSSSSIGSDTKGTEPKRNAGLQLLLKTRPPLSTTSLFRDLCGSDMSFSDDEDSDGSFDHKLKSKPRSQGSNANKRQISLIWDAKDNGEDKFQVCGYLPKASELKEIQQENARLLLEVEKMRGMVTSLTLANTELKKGILQFTTKEKETKRRERSGHAMDITDWFVTGQEQSPSKGSEDSYSSKSNSQLGMSLGNIHISSKDEEELHHFPTNLASSWFGKYVTFENNNQFMNQLEVCYDEHKCNTIKEAEEIPTSSFQIKSEVNTTPFSSHLTEDPDHQNSNEVETLKNEAHHDGDIENPVMPGMLLTSSKIISSGSPRPPGSLAKAEYKDSSVTPLIGARINRRETVDLFEEEVMKLKSTKLNRIRDRSRLLMERLSKYEEDDEARKDIFS